MKKIFLLSALFSIITLVSFAQKKEQTGVITAVKGKTFIVKADAITDLPSKTDTCSISKDISGTKNPFGITISSGWMGIGDVMLITAKGNSLSFKIIKETSNITINGQKQPNFIVGKKVKIEWEN